jgi:N-methylhydantoinase A
MFGYSLEAEGTPVELINVRLRAVGLTEKPGHDEEPFAGAEAGAALKGRRSIYLPEERHPVDVSVYDGHQTRHGNHLPGPALIEQTNTTLLLTSGYDCLCDRYGSFVVYLKGREDVLSSSLRGMMP